MHKRIFRLFTAALAALALPVLAQDSGAADAAERLDASNRHMLWLAFGLYALVLAVYLLWSESRLRKLESAKKP
jgi:hypothetical protein